MIANVVASGIWRTNIVGNCTEKSRLSPYMRFSFGP
jgi:hypothetical protein